MESSPKSLVSRVASYLTDFEPDPQMLGKARVFSLRSELLLLKDPLKERLLSLIKSSVSSSY